MPGAVNAAPYWRLSGFYLFYFATLGALVPYWGLYLQSLGFHAVQIGQLMAVLMATRIVAPNLWGWIADHTGRRIAIIRLAALLALLAFTGVLFGRGFWWLALVMSVFSFFWNAALPQFEATTLSHLGDHTHRYSRIRLWGSIGFILTVTGVGSLLDRYGAGVLPLILLALFAGIWLSSLGAPESAVQSASATREPLSAVLRRPGVAALLAASFLMQVGHAPYYTFYTIYLKDHGYSGTVVGQLWALGVIAEIGVFLIMSRLLARFGPRRLLLASLALAGLRWLLIAWFVDNLAVLAFAQTLHAASFGVYHATAIYLVHRFFTGRHQGRGQALYSSLGFGAGNAVGSLYSGYLWAFQGPSMVYGVSALVSAAAFVVVYRGVRM
ncbi:MAG: MFS transporter [Gammaproteobacteria bacterium]|nr:MFS transporter [Gammaproteobacteria bacterium]